MCLRFRLSHLGPMVRQCRQAMSKKAYRPSASLAPQYPRLVDVSRRSVLDWGLIAVGSLWLGGAGCDRPPLVGAAEAKGAEKGASKEMGLRGKIAISRLQDAGVADAQAPPAKKAAKAAASTVKEPPLPPPGVPPQPRLEDQDPKAAVAPATKEPADGRTRLSGKPAHPRLQDTAQPEKKPRAEKAGKPTK
jgi:hypothetical protein